MVPKQGRTNWSMLSCDTIGTFQRLNAVSLPEASSLRVLSSILAVLLEPLSQFVGHTSQCSNHHCCWRSSMIGWEEVWATDNRPLPRLADIGGRSCSWRIPASAFKLPTYLPTTRKPLLDIIAANLSRQVSQHLSEAKHQLSVDYETRQTNQPEPRLDWLHHAALPEVNKTLTYWSTSHKHKHVITCFKRHKSNVLLHMKEICCL